MMEDSNKSFNLWTMFVVLARRKKFIISFVVVCTIGAIGIALLLPKWYRAKTSILPSQHDQLVGLSGNFAQYTLSSAGFDLPIMATPSDVYATMLQSETIARAVSDKLSLQQYLGIKTFQECYYYLKDAVDIAVTPEGTVEIYCLDKDPEMAAQIANQYIEQLDLLNRKVKAAKAKSDREFIYYRLDSTRTRLDDARNKLLEFQIDNKAIDLVSQKNLAIASATELKTELAMTRVSLDVKKESFSESHPAVKSLESRTAQLEKQIREIESGRGGSSYLNLPLDQIPGLTIRLTELQAEVELQEKVYGLLTELYEEARIKEQKDTPTISILETAYPPELKYKPKRSLIVAATFICSLLLAVFLSLFADYLENLRRSSPSDFELMQEARKKITGKSRYTDS
ncbi:MAG: hypothetical protein KAR42_01355 [candidate division Zixibacteria bacterium]|nr:hypothetical protein [candidate division Zixibacteria bacterium]